LSVEDNLKNYSDINQAASFIYIAAVESRILQAIYGVRETDTLKPDDSSSNHRLSKREEKMVA
jgi:hypothetical protein